jgi:hypothetical protein
MLAAIACHYNPQRSDYRRRNWFQFAAALADQGIDLLTVEGILDGDEPDLPGIHGVRQVEFTSIVWQKEALLNLAIKMLPPEVTAVMWTDADILWPVGVDIGRMIMDALQAHPVIQPWRTCQLLGPDGQPQPFMGKPVATSRASVNGHPASHPGFAWAARREVLDAIGLYDRHVAGGADSLQALAYWGRFVSPLLGPDRLTPEALAHWRTWADVAYQVVGGDVGFIDVPITHLYHGRIQDRQYFQRWQALCRLGYDPGRHITLAPNGTLRWTPAAPAELRDWVSEYLLTGRKESGDVQTKAAA